MLLRNYFGTLWWAKDIPGAFVLGVCFVCTKNAN